MSPKNSPAAAPVNGASTWQQATGPLALAAIVFLLDFLLLRITRQTGRISPIWFANALVLSVLLAQPRARWASYLLASFVANLGANILTGDRLITATLLDLCNVVETLTAAILLQLWCGPEKFDLRRKGVLASFLLACCIFSSMLGGLLAALSLYVVEHQPFLSSWRIWSLSDSLGFLILIPVLSLLTTSDLVRLLQKSQLKQTFLLLMLVMLMAAVAFGSTGMPLSWVVFPAVFLASFQMGMAGAALAILLASLVGTISVFAGWCFEPLLAAWALRSKILLLQSILGTLALSVLPIGVLLAKLRSSDDRHRALLDLSPTPMCVIDSKTLRFLAVNEAAIRHYGYSREEFLQLTLMTLHPPNQPTPEPMPALETSKETSSREYDHVKKDGNWIKVSLQCAPITFEDRPCCLAHIEDITEREHTANRLRELSDINQRIFDASPMGKAVFNDVGAVLSANDSYARIMGISDAALATLNFRTDPQWASSGLLEVAITALANNESSQGEFRLVTADNRTLWLRCIFTPFEAQGQKRLLLTAQDDTERVRAQAEILQARHDLSNILDTVPSLIGCWDASLCNRFGNRGFKAWFGFESQDIAGRHMREVVGDAQFERVRPRVEAVLRGEPQFYETVVATAYGPAETLVSFLPDIQDGEVRGFLAYAVDVTALKKAQREAQAATTATTEFLAVMSHEIRTPLNAVIGYSTLLLDTALSNQQLEYIQAVHTAAEVLLSQINLILDLSKIQAGKLELENQPTDLRLAMEDALEILADAARKKSLHLTCLLSPNCPPFILSDSGRLRQILINLVANAVKFTDSGEIIVRATYTPDPKTPSLRIEVIDTGQGIAHESQSKLFQPFFQVDSSMTRRYSGTGLGLSLSRRLVEAMGGIIGVESQVGVGSTFYIVLPVTQAPSPDSKHQLPTHLEGRQVLVIDPHSPSREQLGQLLTQLRLIPMLCSDAKSTRSALAAVGTQAPSVILVAAALSDADSLELAQIFQQSPVLNIAPIVVLQSTAEASNAQPSVFWGSTFQLLKPVRMRRLSDLLAQLLEPPHAEALEPTHTDHQLIDRFSPVRPPRVLLAEDNPANQQLVSLMLQRFGCRVEVAADGCEAVSAVRSFPYDLVVMDCQMPEMDGMEATQEIRKLPPPMGQVPVVALTANAFREDKERCLEAGMNDFLSKPLTLESLQLVLKLWLATHPLSTETASGVRQSVAQTQQTTFAIKDELASVRARIQELSAILDEEAGRRSWELFLSDSKQTLAAANAQLAAGHTDALARSAHRLAGGALMIGAHGIAQRSKQLEAEAKRGDLSASSELLSGLHAYVSRVVAEDPG